MKLRDVILSIAFCLFLLGPTMLWGTQTCLKAELPSWLTAEDASYLSGGQKKSDLTKHLSPKGFMSEKLQEALGNAAENNIPFRAQALLKNASIQRIAIASSNAFFKYDAYPTFYGSTRLYIPSLDALTAMPDSNPSRSVDRILAFGDALDAFAQNHTDKTFCLVLADAPDTTEANPAAALVWRHFPTSEVRDLLLKSCSAPNVQIICLPYQNATEYYQNYYRSDHHWNGFGTLECYNALADAMDLRDLEYNSADLLTFDGMVIDGSFARKGLMLINEPALEPKFNLAHLDVSGEGAAPVAEADGEKALLQHRQEAMYNFYSSWYGSYQKAEASPITNMSMKGRGNAIVIMDSYGNSLHWLVAENYEHVRCYKDTKQNTNSGATLQSRIDETQADTIYFIGNPYAYADLLDVHPDYFE